jgi:hypothetical protein
VDQICYISYSYYSSVDRVLDFYLHIVFPPFLRVSSIFHSGSLTVLFINSMVLRWGTERDSANSSGGNTNRNNEVPLPEPPIHPTLADVLARQTELMAHLVN